MGHLSFRWRAALFLFVSVLALASANSASNVRADDDHGDFRFSATPLDIEAGAVAGAIQELTFDIDVDYFSFQARRGARYTFILEMVTVQDADFALINSVARGPESSPGQVKSVGNGVRIIEWIARTTDTYFIEVVGILDGPEGSVLLGDYKLTVSADASLEDHHSESRSDATPISPGNLYQGAISPWTNQPAYTGTVHGGDDMDYFFFPTDRGVEYTISAALNGAQAVSISVEQATGGMVATNDGVGNSLQWTAASSDTYYIVLAGSSRVREPVGTYILSIEGDTSLRDRHAQTFMDASPVSFGSANQGAVSPADDVDYFSFQSRRGVRYSFQVDFGSAQAVDVSVRRPDGGVEVTNAGVGNSIEWIATFSDTFYIVIAASAQARDPVGSYSLMVNADTSLQDRHGEALDNASPIGFGTLYQGAVSPMEDLDYFSFIGSRGVRYTIEVDSGSAQAPAVSVVTVEGETLVSGSGTLQWVADSNDSLSITVSASSQVPEAIGTYTLTVNADTSLEDRHADDSDGAAPIGLGTLYQGAVSPRSDVDYFSLSTNRGVRYTIDVEPGSVPAVAVSVIDPSGQTLASNEGKAGGLRWIAPAEDTYFLAVSSSPQLQDPIGTYSLLVNADGSLVDRHGDTSEEATPLSLGTTYQAAISPTDDFDYFSIVAQRGVKYTFQLSYGTAEAVTLAVGQPGVELDASARNYGDGSDVLWTPTADDTYVVAISRSFGVPNPVGTYSLEVSGDGALQDRHGDTSDAATPISFGMVYQGAVSPEDDYDLFVLSAEEGLEYLVQLELGTAEAVRISVTDPAGAFTDSNYGVGNSLRWAAPAGGDYFLAVSGSAHAEDPVGTYRVSISQVEASSPSDAEPTPASASTLLSVSNRTGAPGGSVLVPILIEKAEHISQFKFSLGYDPDVLEVVRVYRGSLFAGATFTDDIGKPGVVRMEFFFEDGISGDGSAALVEFRIVGDQGSSSPLTLSEPMSSDSSGVLQFIHRTDGEVAVGDRISGDGNGDGSITTLDALIALRMAAQTQAADLIMDVDGDGQVTQQDAQQILAMAAPSRES